MLEVTLNEPDDFLKVRETLTRIGVASRKDNKLYQSCHILHKQGRYFIVHFKELFLLDGKKSNLEENDLARRNTIATLMSDWGLVSIDNKENMKLLAPLRQIKIIPFKEKNNWELCPKYNIGNKWLLDKYLIIKDFNFEKLNAAHKSSMIKKFKKDKLSSELTTGGYNTEYDDEAYRRTIEKAFLNIIEDTFRVSDSFVPVKTWIYVQNKERFNSVWHTHVNTSSVNAVFYIDPPKKGGGLNLRLNGKEVVIYPAVNKLYMFPYWMEHRPLPQDDDDWRISVNIEYFCAQRPVVKETGTIW